MGKARLKWVQQTTPTTPTTPMSNQTFPVITTATQFKEVCLEWLNKGMHSGDTELELDAFVEWLHEESEKWLSFEDWESFCMANDMA